MNKDINAKKKAKSVKLSSEIKLNPLKNRKEALNILRVLIDQKQDIKKKEKNFEKINKKQKVSFRPTIDEYFKMMDMYTGSSIIKLINEKYKKNINRSRVFKYLEKMSKDGTLEAVTMKKNNSRQKRTYYGINKSMLSIIKEDIKNNLEYYQEIVHNYKNI
jgi:hypothetical protein